VKVETKALISILTAVKPGLAKLGIVEQMTHFVFTGKSIATYNDRICIVHPFESDFQCSVSAEEFYKVISSISEDAAEVTFDNKSGQLKVESGRTRLGLAVSAVGDIGGLIEVLGLDKIRLWRKLPKDFLEGVFLCMFSVSKSAAQHVLTTMFVDDDRLVSSDGYRISQYVMEKSVGASFLVPGTSTYELVKFPVVSYSLSDAWAHFKTSTGVVFSSRRVEGKYPKVEEYLKTEGMTLVLPLELGKAVKDIEVMAGGEFDVGLDRRITVRLTKDWITCRGEKEIGWVEKDVPLDDKERLTKALASVRRSEVIFSTNPAFLYQVLSKSTTMTLGEGKALFTSGTFSHVMLLPREMRS